MKRRLLFCLIYVFLVYFFKTKPGLVLSLSFTFGLLYSLISFMIGGLIGYFLFYLDFLLYPYLTDENDLLSQKAKSDYFSKKDYCTGVNFVMLNQDKMAFHTLITAVNFVILIILTVFVSSSSGSQVGTGAAYGLLFQFNYQILQDFKNPARLNRWFEVVKTPVEARYQQYFVFAVMAISILISL